MKLDQNLEQSCKPRRYRDQLISLYGIIKEVVIVNLVYVVDSI